MTMYPAKESRHPSIHRLVAGLAEAGVDIGRTELVIDLYVPGIVEFMEREGVHRFAFQYPMCCTVAVSARRLQATGGAASQRY